MNTSALKKTVQNNYKRYSKKDFLEYAEAFDYWDAEKNKLKKMKIDELRDFFLFTHKDNENGHELDLRNYKCLDCLTILKSGYRSTKNNYYCADCL